MLATDFVADATLVGRTVIAEHVLPAAARTVRMASLGGVAGGHKYVVRNCLLKMADDPKLNPTR